MTVIKRINEYDIIRAGYGVAWFDVVTLQAVCLPLPMNIAAGWFRYLWHFLRVSVKPSVIDQAREEAWSEARRYNHAEMRSRVLRELDDEHKAMRRRLEKMGLYL